MRHRRGYWHTRPTPNNHVNKKKKKKKKYTANSSQKLPHKKAKIHMKQARLSVTKSEASLPRAHAYIDATSFGPSARAHVPSSNDPLWKSEILSRNKLTHHRCCRSSIEAARAAAKKPRARAANKTRSGHSVINLHMDGRVGTREIQNIASLPIHDD